MKQENYACIPLHDSHILKIVFENSFQKTMLSPFFWFSTFGKQDLKTENKENGI